MVYKTTKLTNYRQGLETFTLEQFHMKSLRYLDGTFVRKLLIYHYDHIAQGHWLKNTIMNKRYRSDQMKF